MAIVPDLIVRNANVATMNANAPRAEAFCVWQGRIIAIGSSEEIAQLFPMGKKVLDLDGHFLCPGFNDTHTHLIAAAVKFEDIQLATVTSAEEALQKIREQAAKTPVGRWLFGEGWDESDWSEKRYLTLQELDQVAPNHPCFIRRVCGHLAVVNSLALQELDLSEENPQLELDPKTGKPTGILYDELLNRISTNPKLKKSEKDYENAVRKACAYAHRFGITSVTDNLSLKGLKAYIAAKKQGSLKLRVAMNIPAKNFPDFLKVNLSTGVGDEFLRIQGVKIFTDGSIGSRTAALFDPYFDDPTTTGEIYISESEYQEIIGKAIENDWQTATHAIGDRAIELVLKTFEHFSDQQKIKQGRHRIEHAEFLTPQQLERVKQLGLVLSMQPNFAGRWGKAGQLYEQRLGPERYPRLNNFKMILDARALVSFGSDNMPMSPLFGLWSIVCHPIEAIRVNVEKALYCYTLGAAYTTFEEDIKGSLEVGKVADFVVLDKDLFKIEPEEIKSVQVLATFLNGELVYAKEGFLKSE